VQKAVDGCDLIGHVKSILMERLSNEDEAAFLMLTESEHAVVRHGQWRSASTMRGYVADAERFAPTHPTRHLGLRRDAPA
jgi:hypothetical protein